MFRFLRYISFVLLFSRAAFGINCVSPNDQPFTLSNLVSLIRNENCQIKSIDDVIGHLPERMRSNIALFYKSQSLQGPHQIDYKFPRAILSSHLSKTLIETSLPPMIMVSFNGKSSQPGHDRLEVVDIDPRLNSANIFNYYEIDFPSDDQAKGLSWGDAQKSIHISDPNPTRCVQCHGNPARPIFQSYPTWLGAFGSHHLAPMSSDDENGLGDFIKFHSLNKTRYSHLNPKRFDMINPPQIGFGSFLAEKNIDDPIQFNGGSPTIDINTVLANYNGIRVTRMIKSLPFYSQFKYAIAGTLEQCNPLSGLYPEDVFFQLKNRIKKRINFDSREWEKRARRVFAQFISYGPDQFGVFPTKYDRDSYKAHQSFWQNDPVLFALWVDTMEKQGRDRSNTDAVGLRLLFEGLGIDLSNWWTDLRQPTYRANSGFGQPWGRYLYTLDPALKGLVPSGRNDYSLSYEEQNSVQKAFCSELSRKSRSQLKGLDLSQISLKSDNYENKASSNVFPGAFTTTCRKCHVDHQIGPPIPFANPAQLRSWVSVSDHWKKIKFKVFEAPDTERMPPTQDLTAEEKLEIKEYLLEVKPKSN